MSEEESVSLEEAMTRMMRDYGMSRKQATAFLTKYLAKGDGWSGTHVATGKRYEFKDGTGRRVPS